MPTEWIEKWWPEQGLRLPQQLQLVRLKLTIISASVKRSRIIYSCLQLFFSSIDASQSLPMKF